MIEVVFNEFLEQDIKRAKTIKIEMFFRGFLRISYDDMAFELVCRQCEESHLLVLSVENQSNIVSQLAIDRYCGDNLNYWEAMHIWRQWGYFIISKIKEVKNLCAIEGEEKAKYDYGDN